MEGGRYIGEPKKPRVPDWGYKERVEGRRRRKNEQASGQTGLMGGGMITLALLKVALNDSRKESPIEKT